MKTLLITNPDFVITLDKKRRVLRKAAIYLEDNKIVEVGSQRKRADKVIDASGMVVFPGFINTHLHIPQVFHRHCPAQQNKPIAQWIKVTTSINREIDAEAAYYGALVCFSELMLSGATTVLDYFYPFVKGKPGTMEAVIRAAKDIGVRFTCIRGSMSQSKKQGTLYEEDVVEDLETVLTHSQRMIEKYHDNRDYSMTRIGVGPCLPFSSIEEDYRETAKLARKYQGVILQTHAAESAWEVEYCLKKFGVRPIGLMEKTGFLGPDVSLTHCNMVNKAEISLLGKTKTNVVVTPICNTRDAADGNGIAPLTELVKFGANISLGVDGPASNDSMNLQDEMRYFRIVSKAKEGLFWHGNDKAINQAKFSYLQPMQVLEVANLGGAKTLNRNDIGAIEVGKAADLTIFDPDKEISHAGAVNKWGAIMSCEPIKPKYLIVNGKVIIESGQIKTVKLDEVNKKFRKFHQQVLKKAQKRLQINLEDY